MSGHVLFELGGAATPRRSPRSGRWCGCAARGAAREAPGTAGVLDLRGRPLPVVDLREGRGERGDVLVLRAPGGGGRGRGPGASPSWRPGACSRPRVGGGRRAGRAGRAAGLRPRGAPRRRPGQRQVFAVDVSRCWRRPSRPLGGERGLERLVHPDLLDEVVGDPVDGSAYQGSPAARIRVMRGDVVLAAAAAGTCQEATASATRRWAYQGGSRPSRRPRRLGQGLSVHRRGLGEQGPGTPGSRPARSRASQSSTTSSAVRLTRTAPGSRTRPAGRAPPAPSGPGSPRRPRPSAGRRCSAASSFCSPPKCSTSRSTTAAGSRGHLGQQPVAARADRVPPAPSPAAGNPTVRATEESSSRSVGESAVQRDEQLGDAEGLGAAGGVVAQQQLPVRLDAGHQLLELQREQPALGAELHDVVADLGGDPAHHLQPLDHRHRVADGDEVLDLQRGEGARRPRRGGACSAPGWPAPGSPGTGWRRRRAARSAGRRRRAR